MAQNVFHRYEKKYLLDREQYGLLRQRLEGFMEADAYGLHTIRNIYYDTETDDLIRTSLEKPRYKEKFRVRCYGEFREDGLVFLEIKKKYHGLVNKRRAALLAAEAAAYLEGGKNGTAFGKMEQNSGEVLKQGKVGGIFLPDNRPDMTSQIRKEIDYFFTFHQVTPKIYLAYDRIALYGRKDPEFRVTFDTNIRYRNENLRLDWDGDTTQLLGPESYLMEVKIQEAMPLWFVHLLEELKIRGTSFSKYGRAYEKNLRAGHYSYTDGGRVCVC